ncbi:MAG: transcription repressor NadR [Eggerthellaceae bacterium]|jgi:transcriptional regulator of NAD metabolism
MTGDERRKMILNALRETEKPLSGETLGKAAHVSRQVVVQDIALLRTEGYPIVSTNRGYLMSLPHRRMRVLKCHHTVDETEDELTIIVDLGGEVVDVVVNHRVYGKMSAMLNIKNRRDVKHYMDNIRSGKSSPLMLVTSGYHFHHIAADSEEALDEIEAALRERGYLAEVFPYESELTL